MIEILKLAGYNSYEIQYYLDNHRDVMGTWVDKLLFNIDENEGECDEQL